MDKLTINDIAFDQDAKEFVLVSNMICTLPHNDPEAFKASHPNGAECTMAPHEAIALRPFVDGNKLSIAWTYRRVRAEQLQPVSECDAKAARESFQTVLGHRASSRFLGRI